MIYTESKGDEVYAFKIKVKLRTNKFPLEETSWSIYSEDPKIKNILIDNSHNYSNFNILNFESNNMLYLYPNPVSNILNFSTFEVGGNQIFIYELDGKLIRQESLYSNSLDISSLSPGMYILRYKDSNKDQNFRFIKTK